MKRYCLVGFGALMVMSCGGAEARLEPRFVAVHNTMTAMGMAQTGPISEGSLPEGVDATVDVELHGGECYTFVGLGGPAVRDLDVRVVGEGDEELGRDVTHDRQAAAQVCPERSGEYHLVVTMTEGHGSYMVTSWSGTVGGGGPRRASGGGGGGAGTCANPHELTLGASISGDTTGGAHAMGGSCIQNNTAPEHVYRFEVTERSRIEATLQSAYDGALVLMQTCGGRELACNDDFEGSTSASRVSATLDPGTYFLVVDGYSSSAGAYELIVQRSELRAPQAVCNDATDLPIGQPVAGDTSGAQDTFQATCAGGARGPDRVYRLNVPQRSRLRLRQQSNHDGALYVRRTCADPNSELTCNDDHGDTSHSMARAVLDPGSYFVFSDGYSGGGPGGSAPQGPYTLTAELAPAAGGGATGDSCQNPPTMTPGQSVTADTFQAADDYAGTCGGQGSADVVYSLDVTTRSRLVVTPTNPEFEGALYVQRTCGDQSSEVACRVINPRAAPTPNAPATGALDATLAPGQYSVIVDGSSAAEFGSVDLAVALTDLAALDRMCRRAPLLRPGRTVNATTAGGSDDFQATCAAGARSNDKVYRIRLTRRSQVRVTMSSDYDGALHLRRDCADPSTELACNDDHNDNRHSQIEATLDRGTYYLVVDGFRSGSEGSYSVELTVSNP